MSTIDQLKYPDFCIKHFSGIFIPAKGTDTIKLTLKLEPKLGKDRRLLISIRMQYVTRDFVISEIILVNVIFLLYVVLRHNQY